MRLLRRALLVVTAAFVVAGVPAAANPAAAVSTTATVKVFFPRGATGTRCDRVLPVERRVRAPAVLRGAMAALLQGPTATEQRRGYGGWFSARTAGMLLAQLDRTATQFPTVRRAIYSFNGSRHAFYEWLQLSPPRGLARHS